MKLAYSLVVILFVTLYSCFAFSSTKPVRKDNRKRYVHSNVVKLAYVPRTAYQRPKKYVYNMDSQKVTRYAYRKPLPTQVTTRSNMNADIKQHGIGMKLRRAHANDRRPASVVSNAPIIQKERPSQALKSSEIVQLKEN